MRSGQTCHLDTEKHTETPTPFPRPIHAKVDKLLLRHFGISRSRLRRTPAREDYESKGT